MRASILAGRRRICASCKQDIFWRIHVRTGKPAPLDAQPTSDGNIELVAEEHYRVVSAGELPLEAIPRYTSHFATCPNAARHRDMRPA